MLGLRQHRLDLSAKSVSCSLSNHSLRFFVTFLSWCSSSCRTNLRFFASFVLVEFELLNHSLRFSLMFAQNGK